MTEPIPADVLSDPEALVAWVQQPTALARLLDDLYGFLGRFVAYPSDHDHIAHTLWVAHTHAMDAWDSTPRIAFLSPEPGSGKSRALEVTELLVPNPVEAINVTPAYLFRKVGDASDGRPTILYDEIDTVFGPKAKENEEIRGLLNAGHRRHGVAGRCVVKGKLVTTEEIPAYCAVAMAGLGGLPDTLLSRAVVVRMRRRHRDDIVEQFRRRIHVAEGHQLRDRLAMAIRATIGDELQPDEWPEMPKGVVDRDADVWEPLLTIADAAGSSWPDRARCSAVALVALSKESTPSLGIRLLADLKTVFEDRDVMPTEDILTALRKLDESPWDDLYGKPLTARGLAQRLRHYQVTSKNVRTALGVTKGYRREDLWDPWGRYIEPDQAPNVAELDPSYTETQTQPKGYKRPQNDTLGLDLGTPPDGNATSATSATSADGQQRQRRWGNCQGCGRRQYIGKCSTCEDIVIGGPL